MSEMTEQQPPEAGQAPAPGAAPVPVSADVTPQPAKEAPVPAAKDPSAADEDPRDKAARLRAEAAELEASLPPDPGTVRVRVEEPHVAFAFGGAAVSTDWTDVHKALVPGLFAAASDAGVTLTQEEG